MFRLSPSYLVRWMALLANPVKRYLQSFPASALSIEVNQIIAWLEALASDTVLKIGSEGQTSWQMSQKIGCSSFLGPTQVSVP